MKIQSALNTLLSSDATIGEQWYPNAAFDPQEDPIGSFYYTIDDPYCPPDTARFEVHIYSEPIFDLGPDRLLCPGDTTQFTLSISDVDLWWSGIQTADVGCDRARHCLGRCDRHV